MDEQGFLPSDQKMKALHDSILAAQTRNDQVRELSNLVNPAFMTFEE
jgi:hypothetical protein